MKWTRLIIFISACLFMIGIPVSAQRLDIKGIRKKSKASDYATIMFKSDFDDLKVISMSSDSIYNKKRCDYNNVWTQSVDLRSEREHSADTLINRSFILHTPYTKDLELTVPEKDKELRQAIYEYKVRVIDYFPMRIAAEVDVVRIRDYFGLRLSAGKRLGGYLSLKLSHQKKDGFNADERGEEMDLSKKTFLGRIHNSYVAGVKYGIISRDYPVYAYLGFGYGDDGIQRSNGKKGKDRVAYYNNYTNGFEGELGVNLVFFDFLSLSMGADVIFGHRVAFEINSTLGFAIDLTQ